VEEFFNREPHLEGEELFGSQKKKANMPLGYKHNLHRPDKVNISHWCLETRSKRATISVQNLNPIFEDVLRSSDVDMDDAMSNEENLG